MELRWRIFPYVSWVWLAWERLYLWLHPVTHVSPGSLVAFRRRGQTLELHMDNHALVRMRHEPGYTTFKAVHRLREDMAALASRVRSGELGDVRLLHGTSLMGEAAPVLGFQTKELPHTIGTALQQYFFGGLDALYHPQGLRARAVHRTPVELSMTVEELLKRYRSKSDSSTTAR